MASQDDLAAGLYFIPQDAELLSVYLRRKISREPLPVATAGFFHDADVYAAEPAMLVDGLDPARTAEGSRWFFFCSVRPKNSRGGRKSRTVEGGKGTWHSERARKDVVDAEGRLVGHRQSFTYKPKNGDKSGWLMTEFGFDQEDDDESRGKEPVPVLCKIYQTPQMRRPASKSSSSGPSSARKRKAADERPVQALSARVRRQLFPSPPAPIPPTEGGAALESLDKFLTMPVAPEPEPDPVPEESQAGVELPWGQAGAAAQGLPQPPRYLPLGIL